MGRAAKNLHPHLMYHIEVPIGDIDTFVYCIIFHTWLYACNISQCRKKRNEFKMVAMDISPSRHPVETMQSESFRFLPFQNLFVQLSFQFWNVIHRLPKIHFRIKIKMYLEKSFLYNSSWLSGSWSYWHAHRRHQFLALIFTEIKETLGI